VIVAAEPAFRTRHANPYNALLYEAVAEQGITVREFSRVDLVRRRPDIVHLHWPELTFLSGHRPWRMLVRLLSFDLLIARARRRGTRLVWTAHNDGSHEDRGTPALRAHLDRMLRRRVDLVLTLSAAGAIAVADRFGSDGPPVVLTPHPHYRGSYPFGRTRDQARAALGVEHHARLVVAVGQVRPYKNLPALVRAVGELDDPEVRLVVAGHPDGGAGEAELRHAAAGDPRVRLELSRLDDAAVADWLRASDLVVLPYRRILNSGAALLALSADRTVLVPAIGAMPELAATIDGGWVRLFDGDLTGDDLERGLAAAAARAPDERPDLAAMDAAQIAAVTIAAYRRALDSPPLRRGRRRADR